MRKTIFTLSICLLAATTLFANQVNKATVTGNADAAAKAGGDLKNLENAEKAWKFHQVRLLPFPEVLGVRLLFHFQS